MFRICGGGILWFVFILLSHLACAQITLINAGDGKPVKDAIVFFSGTKNEQKLAFPDTNGTVLFPVSVFNRVVIQSTGFRTIIDTLRDETNRIYHLQPLNINLKEVVITGQYHINESSNSVYPVEVFDQKTIEMRAANNLGDLLQNENNMSVSRDPFLGSGVSINGISGHNVKILQDGIPVIGRENGNIDLSQLDLSNTERVEVIRGPMSETFGTDALAGVINLISKKKTQDGISSVLKLNYESNGTYNIHAVGAMRKKKHETSLHLGRNFFDGYPDVDSLRARQWKPKEQYLADVAYTFHHKSGSVSYKGNLIKERLISKGNIIATPYEAYAFDDYFHTQRMSHRFFSEMDFRNHSSLNLTNAFSTYQRSRQSYFKDMVTLKQNPVESNEYSNYYHQLLFRGIWSTYKSWKKINYQCGYDITLDEARGDRTGGVNRKINDYAVFGSAEIIAFNKLIIRPAIRIIYNSRYPAPLVPSLHFKYEVLNFLTIRGTAARGYRAPSVKELYLNFEDSNHRLTGNKELNPELSDFAQISVVVNKSMGSVDLQVQPEFFYNHIFHKISLAQVQNNTLEYTYINIDDFRNMGGNLNISAGYKGLMISSGINVTAFSNRFAGNQGTPSYDRSLSANASSNYTFVKAGLSAGLFFRHFGSSTVYYLENGIINTYHIQDYRTLDITLIKSLYRDRIQITTGLKNIFNVTTTQGSSDNNGSHVNNDAIALVGMGRYVVAGIKLKIGKN